MRLVRCGRGHPGECRENAGVSCMSGEWAGGEGPPGEAEDDPEGCSEGKGAGPPGKS